MQLVLVLMAGAAFVYISSETYRKVGEYKEVLTELKEAEEKRDKALREYAELRDNIEKLYSVKVTPQGQVYELKATAQATGKILSDGRPVYNFRIYVNSPPELLHNITKVTYDFNHPTFQHPHQEATNPQTRFETRYTGWGCLANVTVNVVLKDGTVQPIDFDMCKSIGWD